MNTTVKTPVYHFATLASCCVLLVYRKQEHGIFKRYISFFPRFKFGLTGRGAGGGGGYSNTLPKRVCAAQRGRDFEEPYL